MPAVAGKMGSNPASDREYWGYLIQSDRTPTPLLEQLLLGIAHYIVCLPQCSSRVKAVGLADPI